MLDALGEGDAVRTVERSGLLLEMDDWQRRRRRETFNHQSAIGHRQWAL
jgi:hypothetical protein